MALEDTVLIDREYIDNYAIKDFAVQVLVDKYFPEIDPSLRTSGMIGFTTEQVANLSEDAFNTGTVLFRETFPNRAQVSESIYSHAAIFQISDIFSKAASCTFLLVLEEAAIIENMQDDYDKETGMYYFYIDKNTIIYLEGKYPFTIDYDIQLKVVRKQTGKKDEYLFAASYLMDEYKNSISEVTDPYIKIRRSNDGYIALEISCHQCIRQVEYEPILTNSVINYPTIDIEIDGKLAGFDVLYKTVEDSGYNTQLAKQVIYSQPSSQPFCYYTMKDEKTLRLTFNSKDGFFSPSFSSELKVILYLTMGEDGEFEVYEGTEISIDTDDTTYSYGSNYIVAAKPMTGSLNARDALSIDGLQALAVQGYRTATALTTEPDLMSFFSTFKYTYGNSEVLFIKKRDDVFERIFSAFLVMRRNRFIYNTNTLNLRMNLSEMSNPEEMIYILEPGLLFTANEMDGYAHYLRDKAKNEQYYKDYLQAIEDGTIDFVEDTMDKDELPDYLDRPASFAEYKKRHHLDDKLSIFDIDPVEYEKYDNPSKKQFLLINPFLIRFKKNPNLVSLYLTYIDQSSIVDFYNQNEDCFVQFVMYQLKVKRLFSSNKKYEFNINLMPTIAIDDTYPIIDAIRLLDEDGEETGEIEYKLGDKYNVINNDLRVILVISDGINNDVCFTELWPTEFNPETSTFTFHGEMTTDDHITSTGKLRIMDGTIHREVGSDNYYEMYEDDYTLYRYYDKDGNVLNDRVPVDDITRMTQEGTIVAWSQLQNLTESDRILIPMSDVLCKVYMLYRRSYSELSGQLEINPPEKTSNKFYGYDKSLLGYIWTNEYQTKTERITFVKPLNSVRCDLSFLDYTSPTLVENEDGSISEVYQNDIMDVTISSIPFIRWNIALDEDQVAYFMNTFLNQYTSLTKIINTDLRNVTNLDVKFYNTYGRSKEFVIGEEKQILDTVNLKLHFDVWFIPGTDPLAAIPELKAYIKDDIETINESGMNNLYVSNLMRRIEQKFQYVDHIRFNGINAYDTDYQAVKNYVTDLNELTVTERRAYIPEILVVAEDDIIITENFAH